MKINLEEKELNALVTMVNSAPAGLPVLKKIFEFYIDDLGNIENIDPKGNVGLQTCARQEAVKTLKEIRGIIFPEFAQLRNRVVVPGQEKKKSQWG